MESGLEDSELEYGSYTGAEEDISESEDEAELIVRLNRSIILQGISRVHIDKRDMVELDKQFYKVTHLHLQNKRIDVLDSLHLFHNLTVLYLYENRIREIEGLENATHLELLYLQKNKLDRINGLLECKHLRKLFLGYNEISVVEGLEGLVSLEELHVEFQRLEPGEQLTFDPTTLDALSTRLQVLNISGNGIKSLEDFAGMERLRTLLSRNNAVSDLDNTSLILSTLKQLRELDLRENPITKYHKYKEKLIGFGDCLELLDDKEVSSRTRQFIKSFCQMKAKNLQRMVDSFGGTPTTLTSKTNTISPSGSGVHMPPQFTAPPSRAPLPKFKFDPTSGIPRNQQKQVDHILKRLYPKERRTKSGPEKELQSRANQLIRASGTKLTKPQEISIPQFVLASSSDLKADLGIMTEDEVENARAVTRGGTPPVTAVSIFDMDVVDRSVAAFRSGIQSAGTMDSGTWSPPPPFTSSDVDQSAEKIFLEQMDPNFRLAEMNRHLFGTKAKVKKVKAKAPQQQPQQRKGKGVIRPLATYSVTKPTSPDALRLSQIKSPPNMHKFVSGTGSKMETGMMTPLTLQGRNPSSTNLKGPSTTSQLDPFANWDSSGMVQSKYGLRPKGQPEWQAGPSHDVSREDMSRAPSQAQMEWPAVGISQDQGLWLAQQEGIPLEVLRDRVQSDVWDQPSYDAYYSQPQSLTHAQMEAQANFRTYQRQLEAQHREMAAQQTGLRGSSLPNFAPGLPMSWLQQQYIQGTGNPLFLPAPEVIPIEKPSLTKKKSSKITTDSSQPYMTQVYELPPWPHILRNLGAKDPKVTFMP